MANILRDQPENISQAVRLLKSGRLVAIPTETVYGLAANALDEAACREIFTVKGRPYIDPLIVHASSVAAAERISYWNDSARLLAEKLWPGPLTIVLPKRKNVPDIVTSGLDSVAIRSPRHPLTRKILEEGDLLLAAPSANPFGYISPTTAEHVQSNLGEKIELIMDGGSCEIGLESTIVDLRDEATPTILRPGAITAADMEKILGRPVAERRQSMPEQSKSAAISPGLLERHYSPGTTLYLCEPSELPSPVDSSDTAHVYLSRPSHSADPKREFWLSENGNLEEAARSIYELLRQLDKQGFTAIYMEKPPAEGIGIAMLDRLTRASTQS